MTTRLLSFITLAILFVRLTPCHSQDKISTSNADLILDLPFADNLTVDSNTIVTVCSKILSDRNTETKDRIEYALTKRATAYVDLTKFDDAKKDLDELCTLNPTGALPHILRAEVHRELGRVEDAMRDAREALRLDEKSAVGHSIMAQCLWQKRSSGNINDLQLGNETLAHVKKAMSLDPKLATPYLLVGMVFEGNDPKVSLEAMNKFIELAPHSPGKILEQVYFSRGYSLSLLNRPQEALFNFLVVRKLNPASIELSEQLANTYIDLKRYHAAAFYAQESIRLQPESFVGFGVMAKSYFKLGKVRAAKQAAAKILAMAEKDPRYYYPVADVQRWLQEYEVALEYYDKSLRLYPQHAKSLSGKASILATCPDPKHRSGREAVRLASEALKSEKLHDREKWEQTMVLAEAYAENGEFDKAVESAKQALTMAGPDFGFREEFREELALFEKGLPFRMKK